MIDESQVRSPQTLHLCLVSCFPPSRGPLSEYTYHLANRFASNARISRVTVLADEVNGKDQYLHHGIKVIRCWRLNEVLTPLKLLMKILETKPDLVHFNLVFRQFSSNRPINFVGLCAPPLARLLGIPVVVTLHSLGESVDVTQAGYNDSAINRLGCRLATKLLLRVNLITLTHRHFTKILKERYGAKNVIHVTHGVFHKPIAPCKSDNRRILLFGKIGPYKNLPLVLEAFKDVRLRDKEAELVIAGPSHPLHPGFIDQILENYRDVPNVKVLGYIPEQEVESVIAPSTVIVIPYTISTWSSGVFNLACAFGKPVIASDLPDFREVLDEGAGVLLFPKGDKVALAKVIQSVLDSTELQQRLGEANFRWARNHDFDQTADSLIAIFGRLAAPGQRRSAGECVEGGTVPPGQSH